MPVLYFHYPSPTQGNIMRGYIKLILVALLLLTSYFLLKHYLLSEKTPKISNHINGWLYINEDTAIKGINNKSNTATLWLRHEYSNKDYDIELYEMRCLDGKFRMLSSARYSKEGSLMTNTINSFTGYPEATPGTPVALIYSIVCSS